MLKDFYLEIIILTRNLHTKVFDIKVGGYFLATLYMIYWKVLFYYWAGYSSGSFLLQLSWYQGCLFVQKTTFSNIIYIVCFLKQTIVTPIRSWTNNVRVPVFLAEMFFYHLCKGLTHWDELIDTIIILNLPSRSTIKMTFFLHSKISSHLSHWTFITANTTDIEIYGSYFHYHLKLTLIIHDESDAK